MTALALFVAGLFITGAASVPVVLLARGRSNETVCGIRFFFGPMTALVLRPKWSEPFDKEYVERFVRAYARRMPAAFSSLHYKCTAEDIVKHVATVHCRFTWGPLRVPEREAEGLLDTDGDGKPNLIAGKATASTFIEVGVIPERGMVDDKGSMLIRKTAFTYELHNAVLLRFAGFPVALAEAFVDVNDTRYEKYLNGNSLVEMKRQRALLDAAFGDVRI